jgi:hypothetical protein
MHSFVETFGQFGLGWSFRWFLRLPLECLTYDIDRSDVRSVRSFGIQMRTRPEFTGRKGLRTMRRLLVLFVSVGLFVGAMAGPATADKPIHFSDSVSFQDVNPCTGDPMDITINADVSIHEHGNSFVVHVATSGIATGGFTMHGVEHFVENKNVVTLGFKDVWNNGEGSKFEASGRFKINKDGSVVDEFSLRCVGGPTV